MPLTRRGEVLLIDVVVPVYGQPSYVAATLESLRTTMRAAYVAYRLIIVDDCSPDLETSNWLGGYLADDPLALLLRHYRQEWWTRSVNDGLALCRTNWAFVLNSDLALPDGWVQAMTDAAKEDVAVVGIVQKDGAGKTVHTGFSNFGSTMAPVAARPYPVEWVTGAVWLLNLDALLDVGPLPEKYKHFDSDREWCRMAREKGWKVVCVSEPIVTHYWRRSTPAKGPW